MTKENKVIVDILMEIEKSVKYLRNPPNRYIPIENALKTRRLCYDHLMREIIKLDECTGNQIINLFED
jgi:hypothetical protein